MRKPTYVTVDKTASRCSQCNQPLAYLIHRLNSDGKATFYICWTCRLIFEAGKGLVTQ